MTQIKAIVQTSDPQNLSECSHHWVIQPATGPMSQGNCTTCGASKQFQNYIEASTWRDDKLSNGEDLEVET